jgi:RHS repeat-associated protein
MPLASTWGDLVVGLDIHNVLVPTPAGPVPTPLPHPFIGLTGDPAGAVISAITAPLVSLATQGTLAPPSGAVLVNGVPVMTTADLSHNTSMLAHMPMPPGTAFVKPPNGEGAHHLGSLTVSAGGSGIVRGGEVVMSCSDPVPLPTSTVVAIPKGRPVMVGGPPGVNVAQAVKGFVVGKAVRVAWRAGGALAKFVARYNPTRLRNALARAQCVFTGHPVDVASGRVVTWEEDFRLPGPIPLVFERAYSSGWADRPGPLGYGWSYSLERAVWLEPVGLVCRVADGREIVFETDEWEGAAPPLKREIRDPITGYAITRIGLNSWKVVDPEGGIDEFEPIAGDRVTAERPYVVARVVRSSNRGRKIWVRYRYDEAARLAAVEDSGGRVVRLEYDETGSLARVLLPDPSSSERWITHSSYRYHDGLLVEVKDALGYLTKYAYAGRLLVQETDRNGLSFYWGYDGRSSSARCVRTAGDGGIFNQKLDYDPKGRVTIVTDSFGGRTLYKANEIGLVTRAVAPDGGVTETTYNDLGKPSEEKDALGNITRWSHDRFGHVSITTYADGTKTACKRSARFPELVTLFQNEAGAIWRNRYDAAGQLVEAKAPGGGITSLEWRDGLLRAVVPPGHRRFEYDYDGQSNLSAARVPNKAVMSYEHDLRGRRTLAVNPYGGRERTMYDLIGRVTQVVTPDENSREASYDPEGNVVEVRDRASITRYRYSGFNWIASREEGDGTRADTVHLDYDPEGKLTEIRNEKNQPYRFSYDHCQRLVRELGFDSRATDYKRDPLGRIVRTTRPIGHTEFAYDSRGRLVEEKHSDGTFARFAYRGDGLLTHAENASATVVFERDPAGRIVRELQGDDWIASKYDLTGERTGYDTSRDGHMASIRDPLGQPSNLFLGPPTPAAQMEIGLEYDAAGLEIRRTLPGGLSATWDRDVVGRPRVHAVTGKETWSQTYSWSLGDRLSETTDSRLGKTAFKHDYRGRLYSADFPDGTTQYRAPDEVGNLYQTADRSDRRYLRGGAPRRAGDTTYEFDANGNLVCKGDAPDRLWRYSWDGAGMLNEVARPDGTVVKYVYDALGRRIGKALGETETRWVWDGHVPVHELRSGAPDVTWYYEPESFNPVARFTDDERFTALTDHLGSPIVFFDGAGQLAWEMQLDVYGAPRRTGTPEPPTDVCQLRWPGQYFDQEADLLYNRFRYYDPNLGQYIGPDPIGLTGGLALYAYVPDPLSWIDPFGLSQCPPKTSRAARRDSMRQVGLPTSHTPIHQLRTRAGYQYEYELPTKDGPLWMVVTDQTTDRVPGHGPHWEAGPVKLSGAGATSPRTDPLGRLRVSNTKVKVDYDP